MLVPKIAAELVARDSQQAGSPVVITYPAVVQGPHDPHLGDSVRFVRDLLRGRLPVLPRGRLSSPVVGCCSGPPRTG